MFHDKFLLGKKLGEGAFGQVRELTSRDTGWVGAVKIVDARVRGRQSASFRECDFHVIRTTETEIAVWKKLGKHENCVELMERFFEGGLFYMVMEKCVQSLMVRLVEGETMRENDLQRAFREMLSAIAHVHAQGIVHRDIKPDNFLVGGADGSMVKLCDFGLAAILPKRGGLGGVYGTAPYMAPEMLKSERYAELVDIWSLGATVYLMLFAEFPYMPKSMTPEGMKDAIRRNSPELKVSRQRTAKSVALIHNLPDSAASFVAALLQRDVTKRPSALEALRLEFVQEAVDPSMTTCSDALIRRNRREITENLQKATALAAGLKQHRPDPTVQRNMDELLMKLQVGKGAETDHSRFAFTEAEEEEEEEVIAESASTSHRELGRIKSTRSTSRHVTHSGVLSKDGSDMDSPRSPTSPGKGNCPVDLSPLPPARTTKSSRTLSTE